LLGTIPCAADHGGSREPERDRERERDRDRGERTVERKTPREGGAVASKVEVKTALPPIDREKVNTRKGDAMRLRFASSPALADLPLSSAAFHLTGTSSSLG
jgi:hypothetical protein